MIKWHTVTWYSKLGAIILFIGVVPALCFYIGVQYGETSTALATIAENKNITLQAEMKQTITRQNFQVLGFIELHFPTFDAIAAQNKTSAIATSDIPITKEITIFTPDDIGDARIEIKDLKNGKKCQTANYLVERILLSQDETRLQLYHYSGSKQYVTTLDTNTCKSLDSISTNITS